MVIKVGDRVVWEYGWRVRESKVAGLREVNRIKQWKVGLWPYSIWSGEWMDVRIILGKPENRSELEVELKSVEL